MQSLKGPQWAVADTVAAVVAMVVAVVVAMVVRFAVDVVDVDGRAFGVVVEAAMHWQRGHPSGPVVTKLTAPALQLHVVSASEHGRVVDAWPAVAGASLVRTTVALLQHSSAKRRSVTRMALVSTARDSNAAYRGDQS